MHNYSTLIFAGSLVVTDICCGSNVCRAAVVAWSVDLCFCGAGLLYWKILGTCRCRPISSWWYRHIRRWSLLSHLGIAKTIRKTIGINSCCCSAIFFDCLGTSRSRSSPSWWKLRNRSWLLVSNYSAWSTASISICWNSSISRTICFWGATESWWRAPWWWSTLNVRCLISFRCCSWARTSCRAESCSLGWGLSLCVWSSCRCRCRTT